MIQRGPFCLLRVGVVLLTAYCLMPTALGQSASATLSGTVEDQNSAVVPGATITAENKATGLKRQAITNEEGSFTIPLLPPSRYTVTAQAQGFAPVQIDNVVLNVNDQKSLPIQLKAGNISEMVKIESDAPLINDSPAVGTVIDRQFVENLPLNGRSFQSLITLAPGVVLTKASSGNSGQFSVNGQRANANYFTVDGVSANINIGSSINIGQTLGGSIPGLSAFGSTNNLVSVDAMQEFKIQTSTYAPEFGRTPGGQVQIVTRSGTNDFHGTLFGYIRNEALDANNWFSNANRLGKAPLRQNQFGGTFSGPLLIPRFGEGGRQPWYHGRNRTFFFFSYEGLRLRLPQTVIALVPSLTTRQGAATVLQPILNAYPLPNGPLFTNGFAQLTATYSDPSSLNATSIRIDHTFSDKVTLFGRYNEAPSQTAVRSTNTLAFQTRTTSETKTLTVGSTWSIAPSIVNEIRANYSRDRASGTTLLDNFVGGVPPADSVLFPSFASSDNSVFILALSFGGVNSVLRQGTANINLQRQLNFVDNLSIIKGTHQLKIGIDYRRLFPVYAEFDYLKQLNFGSLDALRSGLAALAAIQTTVGERFPLFTNFSAFGQDTWKVTPRLNLTYGVRWEVNPAPGEADGNVPFALTGFGPPATLALAPRGTPLYKTTYNNFAPRVGVAYQLSRRPGSEMVLRGGFGIFYDLGGAGAAGSAFRSFPFLTTKRLLNVPLPLTPDQEAAPVFNLTPPFALSFVPTDPDLKLPYTSQWNLSVEQSLGSNQTVTASYVAAAGRRLLYQQRLQTPQLTGPAFMNVVVNGATSDYHALQLQFQRRLSRGLQALTSYTWSHSIDEVSDDSGTVFGLVRGSSDFDVRHSFTAALTYNIPTPGWGTLSEALFHNLALDTIVRAQSATPVDVIAGTIINPDGTIFTFRPDLVPGVPLYLDDPLAAGGRKFNPAAFRVPGTRRQGNSGRNVLRGFPVYQVDVSLRRQLKLSERLNLQFSADVFNVFNHPNFGDPINTVTNPLFGQTTQMLGRSLGSGGQSGGLNPLYQVGGPRSIQLAVKLRF
jgi:hypothetical protein